MVRWSAGRANRKVTDLLAVVMSLSARTRRMVLPKVEIELDAVRPRGRTRGAREAAGASGSGSGAAALDFLLHQAKGARGIAVGSATTTRLRPRALAS